MMKLKNVEISSCCYSCYYGKHVWGYGDEQYFECLKKINADSDLSCSFYTICNEYEECE